MTRISLSYLYNFATSLEPLSGIKPGMSFEEAFWPIAVARGVVHQLLENSVFAYSIRSARAPGAALIAYIDHLMAEADKPSAASLGNYEANELNRQFNLFKTVLLAELETLNANFVTQKRGYDTATLIEAAENIFPPELPARVPEAVFDIQEAGKCIAFELPTAAGFHLHRANEAILHRYYDAVTGGKERPKSRNIGDYLAALNTHGVGDPRLKAALKDLKDLHRNPLIHPDQTLESIDDAIALLNGIHNAVVYMLKEIPNSPPGTVVQRAGPL